MTGWQIALLVTAIAMIILVILYIVGNRLQKKQMSQRDQLEAAAQPMTMFIISKKVMKMKEAGLPKVVLEQTPKRMHNSRLPIVKAKIGPQIMNLICDESIFDELPIKGEVKAMVSGIYLVSVKNVRGKVEAAPAKKGFRSKMRGKQKEYQEIYAAEERAKADKKAAKQAKKKK